MILTTEQTAQIVDEEGFYDCRLLQQRFAYKIIGDRVSPIGNVFNFIAPIKIGPLKLSKALVLVGELPNTNLFGGACFNRLFCTQLGSLISVLSNKECYLNGDCLFVDDKQISFTLLNNIKDSLIFHTIIVIESEHSQIDVLPLNEQQTAQFQSNLVECFDFLAKDIFVQTRRDNF